MTALLLALHFAASLVLALYGLHRLWLGVGYLRHLRGRSRPAPPSPSALPRVTVQLPLYNERYVAERVIRAAGAIDYPRELMEIQVLDDSTDETTGVAERAVAELRHRGVQATHVRRSDRTGYKAGALAAGLQDAGGELIAIFDADFVPTRDFLRRVVAEFADPAVGMVQARWAHLNAESSLLTRAQALQLDAHFAVEHGVRAATGCFFNFNGTAGVWRREAIAQAGGWRADTLTEDLDLSYRAQLAGWRFVYRDDVAVPAELPVEVAAYRIQQERWAQGGVQTARKLLRAILRADITPRAKAEAFFQLTGSLAAYPVLVVLALVSLAAGWLVEPLHKNWVLAADGALLALAGLSLATFYGVAARVRDPERWWRRLPLVPVIMVLGAGISLGQAAAVYRGLVRRDTPFRRTPKYHLEARQDGSWRSATYRLTASRGALLECGLGAVVLLLAAAALIANSASPTGVAVLFGAGSLSVGGGALAQRHTALLSLGHAPLSRHGES
jgi:cellulose synthase/poly-beta-1,6-N-acetylglucosamine synthase-like glycosyltransferase